jgi:hypothetical protein
VRGQLCLGGGTKGGGGELTVNTQTARLAFTYTRHENSHITNAGQHRTSEDGIVSYIRFVIMGAFKGFRNFDHSDKLFKKVNSTTFIELTIYCRHQSKMSSSKILTCKGTLRQVFIRVHKLEM